MIKLSVVIITYNEERNIERCILSIKEIADEIIIVDSYSTDLTIPIALNLGAKIFYHYFYGYIEQKNFALTKTSYPHVLSLDADEALSEELRQSILNVKKNWTADGYYFNRLTRYCGKLVRFTSWYPSRKLRLWDKRKGSWGGYNPHDKFLMEGKANKQFLNGDLLHFPYNTIEEHLSQIERFSSIYAEYQFLDGNRAYLYNIIINPLWRFFRDYFIKLGILGGFTGLTICFLSSYETYLKYKKTLIIQQTAGLVGIKILKTPD